MSQPVTFEMEGTCNDGQMIVVKGWPDLGCQDFPNATPKVIRQTTIQKIDHKTISETPCFWLLFAFISITSIVLVIAAHIFRKRDY